MPQFNRNRRNSTAAAALLILLAGLTLAACGGSSKGATGKTTTSTSAAQGRFGARAAWLRACLQKNGITLPRRKPNEARGRGQGGGPGATGPFSPGGDTGAPRLPKGVTRTQLQAAFKKCGGARFGRGAGAIASASAHRRFAEFAACMRANGVNLPAPNTSGKGPIFNTKGIDTGGSVFKAAEAKCMRELRPTGAGAPGPGGPGAAAPGAEGPPGATHP